MRRRLLKSWLWRDVPRRELFVHEDDLGQIEIIPAACAPWCRAEFERIGAFASTRRDAAGHGWTDIYVRKPPPHALANLPIPFDAASAVLAAHLPPFDAVVSGTFSSPEPVPRVRAFGPGQNTGVVLVPDKTGVVVEMISLVLGGSQEACVNAKRAAASLPTPSALIIVDWQRGVLEPLL